MQGKVRSDMHRWAVGAIPLAALLAAGACAHTVAINSPVQKGMARYIRGTSSAGLSTEAGPMSGADVSGRIVSDASAFVLDAGRRWGSLRIPYDSILQVIYGPDFLLLDAGVDQSPSGYPWSAGVHRADYHYLKIRFRDDAGTPQIVTLGLSKEIERPTLELLEQRTRQSIDFETVEACLRGRTRDACGYGELGELNARTTVFVDSSSVHEFMRTENHRRITAMIVESGLPLKVVSGPADADIIVAFRYFGAGRPTCTQAIGYGPDRAVAEVYVSHPAGPRVVMVFDEECRVWRRWLADTFGQAFIRAYKAANRIR